MRLQRGDKPRDVKRDKYGFAIEAEEDESDILGMGMLGGGMSILNPMNALDGMSDAATALQWTKRMQEKDPWAPGPDLDKLIQGGVPDDKRGQVWFQRSGAAAKQAAAPPGHYHSLLEVYLSTREGSNRRDFGDIEKDVDRTFPDNEKYETEAGQDRFLPAPQSPWNHVAAATH